MTGSQARQSLGLLDFPKSPSSGELGSVSTAADASPRHSARSATFRELKNSASSSDVAGPKEKSEPNRSGLVCDQTICARGGRRRTGRPPSPSAPGSLRKAFRFPILRSLGLAPVSSTGNRREPQPVFVDQPREKVVLANTPGPGYALLRRVRSVVDTFLDDSRVAERSARLGRSPPQAVDASGVGSKLRSRRVGPIIAKTPAQFQEPESRLAAAATRRSPGRGRPG
jgi:hypothetical protein